MNNAKAKRHFRKVAEAEGRTIKTYILGRTPEEKRADMVVRVQNWRKAQKEKKLAAEKEKEKEKEKEEEEDEDEDEDDEE